MRIFVTGATGFIGTHLVQRLALTEHRMVCLVRKTSNVSTLKEVGATLVTGDVTDRDSLLQAMNGCCWVINLANIYSF
jgi:dihydroflavonol-4-reductase